MLALSLEGPARLPTQSTHAAVGPRACDKVDALAATLGLAESSENVVVKLTLVN